uniref:Protein odr-4 homolog n=2 Tax=Callorhinchus milii TaxID=7868 RepID=A0A4W3JDQ4_CALMI
MGRSYVLGEYSERYLKKLKAEEKYGTTGILLGQITSTKTYIIFAARTPPKEPQASAGDSPSTNELEATDVDWVCEHARQVSRMLPGGVVIIGVFLIRPPNMTKEEAQDIFRKLATGVENSIVKERIWSLMAEESTERIVLQIYADSKILKLRTYDVQNPESAIKTLEVKPSPLTSTWPQVEGSLSVDVRIPLPTTNVSHLDKDTMSGLSTWAQQILHSSYLVNGRLRDQDTELVEGQKKKTSLKVQFLLPPGFNPASQTTAVIQTCASSITVKGVIHCRAYLHGSKTKVKDAILALKRDALNTVSVRCQMVFEDQIMNKGARAGSDAAGLKAPRRVFASILPSNVAMCDYMFDDEGDKELQERFKELLDFEIQLTQVDKAEEILLEEQESLTKSLQGKGAGEAKPVGECRYMVTQ